MLVFHRIYRAGFPVEHVTNGSLLTIVGGTLGAFLFRGGAVMIQNVFSTGHLSWFGGSSVLGMLLGGIISAYLYLRKHGYPIGQIFDLGIVPIPLGQAIGRLGCLAAGCCYGKPTASWIGMFLPDHEGRWAARYPTQLMSSAINFGIFLFLILFESLQKKNNKQGWPFHGFVFLLYIELFSIHRFAIEFLRGDTISFLRSFSIGHTTTLSVFLLNTVIMFWKIKSSRKNEGS
jgi:phosphatidylglycerol:prolipoprotein diacylglycerol transferase